MTDKTEIDNVHLFQNWHFSSNSIHYLLSLWQRLCTAVPYVKSDKAHYLPVYAPQISKTFLKSRLELVLGVLRLVFSFLVRFKFLLILHFFRLLVSYMCRSSYSSRMFDCWIGQGSILPTLSYQWLLENFFCSHHVMISNFDNE